MDVCVVTNDAVLARFIGLEIDKVGFSCFRADDCSDAAQLYICDMDYYDGPLPENSIGFSYDAAKHRRAPIFLPRPIDAAALQNAVKKALLSEKEPPFVQSLSVDRKTRRVTGPYGEVRLSVKELSLLVALCETSLLSRESAAEIFGDGQSNVVDVYMHYLRKKLRSVCRQDVILSKRNAGYMLSADIPTEIV